MKIQPVKNITLISAESGLRRKVTHIVTVDHYTWLKLKNKPRGQFMREYGLKTENLHCVVVFTFEGAQFSHEWFAASALTSIRIDIRQRGAI